MKATPTSLTDWQLAVTTSQLPHQAARVCILLSLSGMKANGVVSVPRQTLADDLGCAPSRIREAIHAAIDAGLLTRLGQGYPGVTATYQALMPKGTENVPFGSHRLVAEGDGERAMQGHVSVPLQGDGDRTQGDGNQPPNTRARLEARPAEAQAPQRALRSAWAEESKSAMTTRNTPAIEDEDWPEVPPLLRSRIQPVECRICGQDVGPLRAADGKRTCQQHFREDVA